MTQTTLKTTNYTTCMNNYYINRDIIFALSFGRAADHTDLIIFFFICQDHNMNKKTPRTIHSIMKTR